ncbi:hypothetical protein [Mesobacillus zeae]|uniref:Uncharacterized protein n=1 Tax=Mesobacillus zeae TaxID=1917180 RepID=A0A398BNM8_9BACI|nr:hypothetical protein [Mesobacillus zeae]RID88973.1 hypothetical protein D1970_00285 [Mesobacillus zeae]
MRKYTVGINVNTIDELVGMGVKVKAFLTDIGDGDLDLQLMVNPHGDQFAESHAIGFVSGSSEHDTEDDEEIEE